MTRKADGPAQPDGSALPLAPPSGMRDLLPPEAERRRLLGQALLSRFASLGYELIRTPAFEYAEVIERGVENVDRRDLLRFVEPETGEVALLRPDITPQVARVVASRLADRPPPWRLCYEGTVFRRRRGRARRHREISQAGVECIGLASPEADVEVIGLCASACSAVGLANVRIELGHVALGKAALAGLPVELRVPVADALSRKDRAQLEGCVQRKDVPKPIRSQLLALVELYGDVSVLKEARKLFRDDDARQAIDSLERIAQLAERRDTWSIGVDLGELRRFNYYTGVSFTLLAEGPGQPIAEGGRYDRFVERFGASAPATGFAIDLAHLEWALERSGAAWNAPRPTRVAVGGGTAEERATLASAFREKGATAAVIPYTNLEKAAAFSRSWGYDATVVIGRGSVAILRSFDQKARTITAWPLSGTAMDELLLWFKTERG